MTGFRPLRATATVLTLAIVGTTLAACSTRAPADQILLYYSSGLGDNKTFHECIEPGTAGSYPIDDEIFALPTSLRTWNIRPDGGDTNVPIKSGTKPSKDGQPGPEVEIWATVEFYLNTNCDGGKDSPVVQFWEKTGRRYGLSKPGEDGFDEEAWKKVLLNTLAPAEEKAIREAARNFTADELDANTDGVWRQMEDQLGTMFLAELKAKTGGDYFCGPSYNRASQECPAVRISITDVNFADKGIAEARARVFKAEQDAKAALIAAQAQVDQAKLLSQAARDANYMELKRIEAQLEAAKACAANPNCTLIIGGPNGINVNAGK